MFYFLLDQSENERRLPNNEHVRCLQGPISSAQSQCMWNVPHTCETLMFSVLLNSFFNLHFISYTWAVRLLVLITLINPITLIPLILRPLRQ